MLRRAHRAYAQALQQQLLPLNITLPQYLHLRVLWDQDGLTQVEISQHVGVEKASSTVVFDALENAGFILRERSTDDRRKVNVELTSAGRQLQEILRPAARQVAAAAVADIDETDVEIFLTVLTKMISSLKASGTGVTVPENADTERRRKPIT